MIEASLSLSQSAKDAGGASVDMSAVHEITDAEVDQMLHEIEHKIKVRRTPHTSNSTVVVRRHKRHA